MSCNCNLILKSFLFGISFLEAVNTFGQLDSIQVIKTVEIVSTRGKDFAVGSKTLDFDSATTQFYNTNNLASLLNNVGGVFIKNYGVGGLATSSLRGGSAYHTAVIWNGFNIANPLNGNVDFNLIKNFLVDEIAIQYGGSSAIWGSGAIGGAILINNKKEFEKGLFASVGGSIGSFGDIRQNLQIGWSSKKFNATFKVINENAENNFEYKTINIITSEGSEKIKQVNNQLAQTGLLSENYLQLSANNKLNLIGFYQKSHRQIAPSIFQANNHAIQLDETARITSEWQHTLGDFIFQTRAAFFNEKLSYSDDFLLNESDDKSNSLVNEFEMKYYLNKSQIFNVGVNNTYVSAQSVNFENKIKQNQFAAFAAYRFHLENGKLDASLSIRKGIQNNFELPLTYTSGINVTLLQGIITRAQVAQVYRIPTINDLYWRPGGNPDLRPEQGFTQEIGINIDAIKLFGTKFLANHNSIEKFKVLVDITYFNKNIQDWIIWLPQGTIWSPKNIFEVWSRGAETNFDFSYNKNSFKLGVGTKINYVISTNQKVATKDDLSYEKQLIYVPLYTTTSNIFCGYKNLTFNLSHQYTGYRYTTSDNFNYLPPYQIVNFQAAKSIDKKNKVFKIYASINNILDEDYQVLQSRPMPLRSYQIGINITINQIKKQT